MTEHKSVLKKETIDLLQIKPEGIYVDLTLGGGGHSLEIAKKLKTGVLISLDVDKEAITNYELRIKNELGKVDQNKERLITVNENFTKIGEVLMELKIDKVDGLIADLGWSTDQLSTIKGLSFERPEEELDMRFNTELGVKASDLLNVVSRKQLKRIFEEYADIRGFENKRLAEMLIERRYKKLFVTVADLLEVIDALKLEAKGITQKNEMRFKAQVFQALRIAVNSELENLKVMLEEAYKVLKEKGRFIVITFHSKEEEIVKEFFDEKVKERLAEYISKQRDQVYTRASVEELMDNINARSAKLFALEKLKI